MNIKLAYSYALLLKDGLNNDFRYNGAFSLVRMLNSKFKKTYVMLCVLQCFDTVGWAPGRASGL